MCVCESDYGRWLRETPTDGTGGHCRSDPCSLSQFCLPFLCRKQLTSALCHLELGSGKQFDFELFILRKDVTHSFLISDLQSH